MNLFAKQKYRHRHREQTYGYQAEERGCGINWEVGIYIYTISSIQLLSYVFDSLRPHGLQHARPPCHHQLLELAQTHVHRVSDAIQPSHPLSSPSPCAFNLSQHQGLFQ